MSEEALKDFLRQQARSLDSLLELTPAKNMFGGDVSDQWQRKKQTPEQKKAARMAKLDPANWKTAKDVYDERSAEAAKKRRRDDDTSPDHQEANETRQSPAVKKQRGNSGDAVPKPVPTEKIGDRERSDVQNKNLLKRTKKRLARIEKNKEERERKEKSKAKKFDQAPDDACKSKPESDPYKQESLEKHKKLEKISGPAVPNQVEEHHGQHEPVSQQQHKTKADAEGNINSSEDEDGVADEEVDSLKEDVDMRDDWSTATSSQGLPDILSPPHGSASSSVSSIQPATSTPAQQPAQKQKTPQQPINQEAQVAGFQPAVQSNEEREAARQRLQEQISQFRTQRKADDKPVRSRAELLEQRKRKEQEKKAAKKEQRRKEKEEETKRQDEEIAKRFSPGGSGSLLASPMSPMMEEGGGNAFTFGRIAFDDGTQFDPSTGSAASSRKHKGAADPATALKAAQAKDARTAGLDDQKRQDIAEKDMWLNARKRAHGERVKDNTSLLKKALKRQDKQKQRSGKEWDSRVEGVRSSQEAKQKRRTENLQKRKDEKGTKKSGSKPKKVKRPGFEGSFRGRTGKGKKN